MNKDIDTSSIDSELDKDNDLDLSISGGNGNKRKPVSSLQSNLREAMGSAKSSMPKAIGSHLLNSMPHSANLLAELQQSQATMSIGISEFKQEWTKVTEANRRLVGQALPEARRYLPKRIYKRLSNFANGGYKAVEGQEEASFESELMQKLDDVFASGKYPGSPADISEKKEEAVQDKLVAAKKDVVDRKKLAGFADIREQLLFRNRFLVTVQQSWMRKSLEIQYRHLFIAKESLAVLKANTLTLSEGLKDVVKNTSLPDIFKYDSSKSEKKTIYGSVYDVGMSRLSNIGTNAIKNLKENITDNLDDAASAIDMSADAMSMQSEYGGGLKKGITRGIGSSLGKIGGHFVGRALRPIIGKRLDKWNQRSKDITDAFSSGGQGASMMIHASKNPLLKMLLPFIRTSDLNVKVGNSMLDRGDSPAPFDVMTRQSIVEVIPAWLAKIAKNTKDIRMNKDTEEERYDIVSRGIVGKSVAMQNFSNTIFGDKKTRSEGYAKAVGATMAAIKDSDKPFSVMGLKKSVKKIMANAIALRIPIHSDFLKPYLEMDSKAKIEDMRVLKLMDGVKKPIETIKALYCLITLPNGKENMKITRPINDGIYREIFNGDAQQKVASMLDANGYRDLFQDKIDKDGNLSQKYMSDEIADMDEDLYKQGYTGGKEGYDRSMSESDTGFGFRDHMAKSKFKRRMQKLGMAANRIPGAKRVISYYNKLGYQVAKPYNKLMQHKDSFIRARDKVKTFVHDKATKIGNYLDGLEDTKYSTDPKVIRKAALKATVGDKSSAVSTFITNQVAKFDKYLDDWEKSGYSTSSLDKHKETLRRKKNEAVAFIERHYNKYRNFSDDKRTVMQAKNDAVAFIKKQATKVEAKFSIGIRKERAKKYLHSKALQLDMKQRAYVEDRANFISPRQSIGSFLQSKFSKLEDSAADKLRDNANFVGPHQSIAGLTQSSAAKLGEHVKSKWLDLKSSHLPTTLFKRPGAIVDPQKQATDVMMGVLKEQKRTRLDLGKVMALASNNMSSGFHYLGEQYRKLAYGEKNLPKLTVGSFGTISPDFKTSLKNFGAKIGKRRKKGDKTVVEETADSLEKLTKYAAPNTIRVNSYEYQMAKRGLMAAGVGGGRMAAIGKSLFSSTTLKVIAGAAAAGGIVAGAMWLWNKFKKSSGHKKGKGGTEAGDEPEDSSDIGMTSKVAQAGMLAAQDLYNPAGKGYLRKAYETIANPANPMNKAARAIGRGTSAVGEGLAKVGRGLVNTGKYAVDLYNSSGFKIKTIERLKGLHQFISPSSASQASSWRKLGSRITSDFKNAKWVKGFNNFVGDKMYKLSNYAASKGKVLKWINDIILECATAPKGFIFKKVLKFLGSTLLKLVKLVGKFCTSLYYFAAGIARGFLMSEESASKFNSRLAAGSALSKSVQTLLVVTDAYECGIATAQYIKLSFTLRKFLKDDRKAFEASIERDKEMTAYAMSVLKQHSEKDGDPISPAALEWATKFLSGAYDETSKDISSESSVNNDKFDSKKYDKVAPAKQAVTPVTSSIVAQPSIVPNRSSIAASIPQYREAIINKPSNSSLLASPAKMKGITAKITPIGTDKPGALPASAHQKLIDDQMGISKATNAKLDVMIAYMRNVDTNTAPIGTMHTDLVTSMDNVATAAGQQKTVVVPQEPTRQNINPIIDRRKSV